MAPEPTFTKVACKMKFNASIPNAPTTLEKKLARQQGVDDVKVDPETGTATWVYSGPVRNVKQFETMAGSSVSGKMLTPAIVEFDVKGRGNAKFADLTQRISGMVSNVLTASGSKLEVVANLESTDWSNFFEVAADTGHTLKAKSHSFLTFTWSETTGDIAQTAGDIAKAPGVIVVKPGESDDKKISLIGDAKTDVGGLQKIMKKAGFSLKEMSTIW